MKNRNIFVCLFCGLTYQSTILSHVAASTMSRKDLGPMSV